MIRNVAALLQALQAKEMEAIARSGITHAPTIGAQYEGLTSTLLARMIPAELDVQVVSGFVEGIDGVLSGQIDCMLVRGEGTPVPHAAGTYKWPIRNVLGVFEVKKTLFGDGLNDASDQLQSVMDQFWKFLDGLNIKDGVDISAPRYIYGQISGEPAPEGEEFKTLSFDREQIYRLLVNEHIAPFRIILGYFGYKTEYSLREGFLNFLTEHQGQPRYAGSSLPSLIVCGRNSIVKVNGQPYYFPLRNGKLLCYASSAENPIIWILNLVLNKISHLYSAPEWYGRDLSIDRFSPLLWGRAVQAGARKGWEYDENPISRKQLNSLPTFTAEEWRPVVISESEAMVLGLIGDGISRDQLLESMQHTGTTADQVRHDVDDLVSKRFLGWKGEQIVFLTRRCATVITPEGEILAADMEDDRLAEWVMRDEQWNGPAGSSRSNS